VPLSFLFYHNKQLMTFKDLRSKVRGKAAIEEHPRDRKNKKEGDFRHFDIIKQLRTQDRLPLLYFVFSRALADKLAQDTARKMDFTSNEEKQRIEEMVACAIEKYQLQTLKLPRTLEKSLSAGLVVTTPAFCHN
jgi:superfamily II RNA helicase